MLNHPEPEEINCRNPLMRPIKGNPSDHKKLIAQFNKTL
jgi:hypothetical protein